MFKTTEKDLEAIGTFFTALASSLLPEGTEVKQQFPWERVAKDYDEAIEKMLDEAFDGTKESIAETKDQSLRAAKLYISTEEIAKRLGIANSGSIVVADVENNNTSDSSVVLTVFVDSTAKQDLESAVEISDLLEGAGNLRRQTFTPPQCNTACQYTTAIDLLNEKLAELLNQRDLLNYTYGDSLHNTDDSKISVAQYNFANVVKKIKALETTIKVLSEDNQ